mmetsp:Transcript_29928/g.95751  ORF Transcript_29928/g.95751 Transcript_29928/m.95751 type:complete len:370 (-) Transcript_29928:813-1922(-)
MRLRLRACRHRLPLHSSPVPSARPVRACGHVPHYFGRWQSEGRLRARDDFLRRGARLRWRQCDARTAQGAARKARGRGAGLLQAAAAARAEAPSRARPHLQAGAPALRLPLPGQRRGRRACVAARALPRAAKERRAVPDPSVWRVVHGRVAGVGGPRRPHRPHLQLAERLRLGPQAAPAPPRALHAGRLLGCRPDRGDALRDDVAHSLPGQGVGRGHGGRAAAHRLRPCRHVLCLGARARLRRDRPHVPHHGALRARRAQGHPRARRRVHPGRPRRRGRRGRRPQARRLAARRRHPLRRRQAAPRDRPEAAQGGRAGRPAQVAGGAQLHRAGRLGVRARRRALRVVGAQPRVGRAVPALDPRPRGCLRL